MLKINKENFNNILNDNRLSVIQFSAEWCGPCKMLSPIMEEVSNEYESINIGKIDVDNDGEIAINYGIKGIPAILFLKNGEVVDRLVGIQTKKLIEEKIDVFSV